MAQNDIVSQIKDIVTNVPLEEVLDTAEALADFIPFPGSATIIKVLKVLLIAKPAISATTGLVSKQVQTSAGSKRETFDRMWNIAISDGIITEDEKNFLRPHAEAAGISDAEFELMIINKTNIK